LLNSALRFGCDTLLRTLPGKETDDVRAVGEANAKRSHGGIAAVAAGGHAW